MRFTYFDINQATKDANILLAEKKSKYRIKTIGNYEYGSVIGVEGNEETILLDNVPRDEVMRYLQGANETLLNL